MGDVSNPKDISLDQCNIVVCTFSSFYRRAETPQNDVVGLCGTYLHHEVIFIYNFMLTCH